MDPDAPYTTNEQMVTKLFRIKNVEVEPLRGVLQQLVSKDGDTIPYPPDIVIINDVGSNVHRLERIIDQLDTRAASDEVRIIQVQYATAQDVAATVQKLFEPKGGGGRPGADRAGRSRGDAPRRPGRGAACPAPGGSSGSGGPVTLSQIIPDERTNKLIIVASPAAFERIQGMVRELDIPTAGDEPHQRLPAGERQRGGDRQHAADAVPGHRQPAARAHPRASSRACPAPAAPRAPATAELFAGEVKISADKGTNSLVIIASQSDYRNLVRVIESWTCRGARCSSRPSSWRSTWTATPSSG